MFSTGEVPVEDVKKTSYSFPQETILPSKVASLNIKKFYRISQIKFLT